MKDYIPARLVKGKKGKGRWYFLYYQTNPATGIRERRRESFDIGRLPIKDRHLAAREIIANINARLPFGYPFDEDFYCREVAMSIPQAFDLVKAIGSDLRHATIISYASSLRKFEAFLHKLKIYQQDITAVTRKVAMAYSDHLISIKLSGRSHNNDINEMRRVFNILKSREIIAANPFDNIPKRRVEEKTRRGLEQYEIKTIIDYISGVDVSVYLSCAILYFCFIRPNEQRFLRRSQIDLERSVIHINGEYSKNHKTQFVTIPDQLKAIFISLDINSLKPSEYVIGFATKLGKESPIGKSGISNRYRALIQEMHRKGLLKSIIGNTLYSWKDTGADALGRSGVNGVAFRDQLRHHSLAEAQTYLGQPRDANEYIRVNHRL